MDNQALERELSAAINAATDEAALEAVRIAALGKKGTISELLKTLGKMSPQERQIQGPLLNGLKNRVTQALMTRREALKAAALTVRLEQERLDVTLPVRRAPAETGRIHPISQVIDEISAIFADMGFHIVEGPDIESDYYNFTALNFPPDHPAREMHDTFFFHPDETGARKLLRTHTSPVQIRTLEQFSQKWKPVLHEKLHAKKQPEHGSSPEVATDALEAAPPPLRIIVPGKTYRMDSDATHSPMFHQIEGLVVDREVTIAHMMWVLEEFCRAFFEVPAVKMRFRPSFFPFTEPSMEVDIQCARSGTEIRFGEGSDWLEILGCGMVHPNVLRGQGLDPDIYQGFAWGLGIDRIAMLKYGMADLRAFFESDIRWINHYGFRPLDIPTLFGGLSQ